MKTINKKAQKKKAKRHIKNADYYNDDKSSHKSKYALKKARQEKGIYSPESPLRCLS